MSLWVLPCCSLNEHLQVLKYSKYVEMKTKTQSWMSISIKKAWKEIDSYFVSETLDPSWQSRFNLLTYLWKKRQSNKIMKRSMLPSSRDATAKQRFISQNTYKKNYPKKCWPEERWWSRRAEEYIYLELKDWPRKVFVANKDFDTIWLKFIRL